MAVIKKLIEMLLIKTCRKCNVGYPATPDYFYRNKRGKHGLRSLCKSCCGIAYRVTRTCLWCGVEFPAKKSQVGIGRGNFCSIGCGCHYRQGEKGSNWKGGKTPCVCQGCGHFFEVHPGEIARGGGRFCSKSCAATGANNPNWKGGIAPKNHLIRASKEYKDWRGAVYERDRHTCQYCGDNTGGNLHAHHIFPFAGFPEHRFDTWNGTTLCVDCHNKLHYKEAN